MKENIFLNKILDKFKMVIVITIIILLAKLILVSTIQSDGFSLMARNQTTVETVQPLARGKILDRNGEVFATSKQINSLKYIESNLLTGEKKVELSKKIANVIALEDFKINSVEIKDYYLAQNNNFYKIVSELSEEEHKEYTKMNDIDRNNYIREKVNQEEIDNLINEIGSEAVYILLKMNQSTIKKDVVIKESLTTKEIYAISKIENEIGGFFILEDFIREYPQGQLMRSFIGQFGPIPKELENTYKLQGYGNNEKVGISYLEKELEYTLRANPSVIGFNFDKDGNIISKEVLKEGKVGNNVYLTIDMNYQRIVENEINSYLTNNSYKYAKTGLVTISDPKNGNLLSLAGKVKIDGQILDHSIANFTQNYIVGSVVKPAILLLGYNTGAVSPGVVINDHPLQFQGTPVKKSYVNMGPINDNQAIAKSSNVYFFNVLLNLAKQKYVENGGLNVDPEYFNVVRNYLKQFGLGTNTGINISNEATGVIGNNQTPGLYLDLGIGQYDTYSNLQLDQYINTIASGGNRYAMQYVGKIVKPTINNEEEKVIEQTNSRILNNINATQENIHRVQQALIGCLTVSGGTCRGKGFSLPDQLAAKTGTAESFYYDESIKQTVLTNTTSFIGYYPANDPIISISVMTPHYTSAGNVQVFDAPSLAAKILNILF